MEENALRAGRTRVADGAGGRPTWNHAEFRVRYASLVHHLCIAGVYIKLLLDGLDQVMRPAVPFKKLCTAWPISPLFCFTEVSIHAWSFTHWKPPVQAAACAALKRGTWKHCGSRLTFLQLPPVPLRMHISQNNMKVIPWAHGEEGVPASRVRWTRYQRRGRYLGRCTTTFCAWRTRGCAWWGPRTRSRARASRRCWPPQFRATPRPSGSCAPAPWPPSTIPTLPPSVRTDHSLLALPNALCTKCVGLPLSLQICVIYLVQEAVCLAGNAAAFVIFEVCCGCPLLACHLYNMCKEFRK